MSTIAFLTLCVSIGAVLGILLGQIRYRGIGLGIGGVLFSGILVGHFAHEWFGLNIRTDGALTAEGNILNYVQEFGLILFVYAIGVQVGPSFFASLRGMGVKLIGWAVCIILGGCVISLILYFSGIVPLDAMIGMYSGGITNTPALGAGTAMISDMAAALKEQGIDPAAAGFDPGVVPSAYAMAYPFGVCSLLITIIAVRIIFGISIEKSGEEYKNGKSNGKPSIITENVEIENGNFEGKTINDIPGIEAGFVVCSRIMRAGQLSVPSHTMQLKVGDVLHLVGLPQNLARASLALGKVSDKILTSHGSAISVRHLIVTNNHVLGKPLGSLDLEAQYDIVVSRVIRAGVNMVAAPDLRLAFGDEINVVGRMENIEKAGRAVGNSSATLTKVPMLPIFVGLLLGILLGNIPIPIPGVPAPLKLGLAGGPLVMAILLSRFGDTWTHNMMHWRLPGPALSAFREMGITLFLTIVGINAGASGFWQTLTHGDGFYWMCWATLISLIPLFVVAVLALKFSKVNYLVLSGMLAGSYTDPPALAFSTGMYKDPEAASIGYATVYPVVMFLRILSPQIMIVIAAAFL